MKFRIIENRLFDSVTTIAAKRSVKDYEIDIELGNGRIYSYGDIFEKRLSYGDVLVRKPHGTVISRGKQTSYLLTLDFSGTVNPSGYTRNFPGPFQKICTDELVENLKPLIHPVNVGSIMAIYKNLIALPVNDSPAGVELVSELIFTLNAEIARRNYELLKSEDGPCNIAINYMQKNVGQQISLDYLADLVHLEKTYFVRLFRKTTGKTPIEMLISLRMDKASDLIANTNMKICDISEICGYNTTSFFISEYKKRYGMTPEVHRKSLN